MRKGLVAAALALSGCGVVYTSPSVYDSTSSFAPDPAFAVQVVPLTVETAMNANLDPYVPARLPDAFRPAPGEALAPMAAGDTRMPDIPAPRIGETGAGPAAATDELPPAATRREPRPEELEMRLPPEEGPRPYRIGVADVLLLSVNTSGATLADVPALLNAQSARQGYVVQDDGAIAVPDVGRIQVAGLTLEEAEAEIFQALVAQRLDPSFSLEVADFRSQRVSIGGAVRQPAVQPITLRPLYLSEALQLSGGVATERPEDAMVRLFRDGQVYRIPVERLYDEGGLADVALRDGDAVFVDAAYDQRQARAYFEEQLRLREAELREREFAFRQRQAEIEEVRFGVTLAQFELEKVQLRRQLQQMRIDAALYNLQRNNDRRADATAQQAAFNERLKLGAVARDYVYVAGEVRTPRRTPLPFETRAVLADVLFDGTGLNINFADYSEIYLLRRSGGDAAPGALTAYHLNGENAANLSVATLMELRPNDILFVAEQPVTAWGRVVNQLVPSLLNTAAAVANAGG